MPWIKSLLLIVPLVLAVYLAMHTKSLAADNAKMVEQNKQLKAQQVAQNAELNQLTERNADLERIFKQKQQRQQQVEVQLREDISSLRQALAEDECYQRPWPNNVIKRLQQPY
ncbi:hypothetical protein UA31_03235 [Photobacterium angustum]|nr:hypothetical protein UB36_03235 [Photobacterium damselae subsp. damselae]KJG42574.1 hypothetical protein UA35_00825 [Photobacterium angustum]KJG47869.1 hypothetical protein UA31_03235 [Photobacterium angustum]KJG49874.1 hypothetical protein UA30_04960 [Photobacterium angustum]KJG54034.1 hypothetical protein UA34_07195 [Photobacterium angustum]